MIVEATHDPGWAYCPRCNASADDYNVPNCRGFPCNGRSTLPIPTTLPRPGAETEAAS